MGLDFYDLLQSIIIFQLSILIFVLLVKGARLLSNRLLVLFFFAQLVVSLNAIWWNHYQYSLEHFAGLNYFGEPFYFVWGPTMFLFIVSQIKPSFKLKPKHLLHFIPSIIIALYFLVSFHFQPHELKRQLIETKAIWSMHTINIIKILVIVHVASYNIIAIVKLSKFQKNQKHSTAKERSKLNWNKFILLGYFFACIFYNLVVIFSKRINNYQYSQYLSFIIFAIFFTTILLKALLSNQFSYSLEYNKTRTLWKPENQLKELLKNLETILEKEKPFLNFSYSIKDISERMNVSERLISQSINEFKGQNFNDFINTYRIDEAKRIISEQKDSKMTFLEVAYNSGFNSKSTFNLVFKKHTNLTPTQFKNSILNNSGNSI